MPSNVSIPSTPTAGSAPAPLATYQDAAGNNALMHVDSFVVGTTATPVTVGSPKPVADAAAEAALARLLAIGLGGMQPVPGASGNGTPLGVFPTNARGVRMYPNGGSITFTIAGAQPQTAPTAVITVSASTGPNWDEDLCAGQMVYVTNTSGSPLFRWY